ncbi:uncharacterized protein LOC101864547 [Aplysia californica]|uniref:Uncharacterized protein LOC101864547 n=1 Tax=Aplysia californica TaxID=6500 RepID=A0ABM0K1E1_APLCA|nr:uncharacterized protein LOC101864547 [Aplysia californica]
MDPKSTKFSKKYILCMFWSTMTLTTIGERPPPVTEVEYIFTGFTFLVGVFVFAAVVGNVGDVISNMNAARRDFQARMDQIKFYMDHRSVPDHLQTRIKRWAEYTWDRTKAIDEPNVLQFLPDRLRTEVAIHVHLDILKQVSIFDECEEGLLRELVLKLKPQIFSPGDYICRIGEIGREMYIINHGKVEILFPDGESGGMKQVAVMNPGNFFGEISLLKLDDGQNKRTADVRSIGFSELLCLSRRDLMLALTEYPDAKKVLEEYARQRYNNTKRMTPTDTEESRSTSPRPSVFSSMPGRRSAKQVFARVMKQEGFVKLLADKTSDLQELKAAVYELKESKNAELEESFVTLQRQVQQLEKMLLDKNLELQESKAHISYLETVVKRLSHDSGSKPGSRVDSPVLSRNSPFSGMNRSLRWQELHRVNTIVHDMQKNIPINKLERSMSVETQLGRATSGDPIYSEQPTVGGNPPLVHNGGACQVRRNSFRLTPQKNVNSNDLPLCSSHSSGSDNGSLHYSSDSDSEASDTDSAADGDGSPHLLTKSDNTATVLGITSSSKLSMMHLAEVNGVMLGECLQQTRRRASLPRSNYGHNVRTYIQRSATVCEAGGFTNPPANLVVNPRKTPKTRTASEGCDSPMRRKFGGCVRPDSLYYFDKSDGNSQATSRTFRPESCGNALNVRSAQNKIEEPHLASHSKSHESQSEIGGEPANASPDVNNYYTLCCLGSADSNDLDFSGGDSSSPWGRHSARSSSLTSVSSLQTDQSSLLGSARTSLDSAYLGVYSCPQGAGDRDSMSPSTFSEDADV